jgi:hypothetical protein
MTDLQEQGGEPLALAFRLVFAIVVAVVVAALGLFLLAAPLIILHMWHPLFGWVWVPLLALALGCWVFWRMVRGGSR